MKRRLATYILVPLALVSLRARADDSSMIEKQLAEIGSIQNEEIVVVQRKYTKKDWRHEFTPVIFGGVPFGTVRRTLLGGASYTLHASDGWGFELLNFSYTKTFFSSFTDDINNNKLGPQAKIKPDFQKLLYFLTTGIQWTPIYGKMATFSRYIAYIEPYFGFGVGLARTESASYVTFYPAVGIRAFFREWFSMKFEFRDYLYTENYQTRTNPPTAASALRNNYAVTLSLSFWLPKMPL
jgi:outer membrane beta-barrel protein